MRILVSACLLGVACKYSGGGNSCPALRDAVRAGRHELIPFCPEVYGGLPTPRTPAERRDGGVYTRDGRDVTAEYLRGAEAALALAKLYGCRAAILKAGSPSCGYGRIYDGSFTGKKIDGSGLTAELLAQNGLAVFTEEALPDFL